MWISRNMDSMLFVVFCPLQPGQVSGVAQGLSVTDKSRTRRRARVLALGFLDDECTVAVAADVDLRQERFHGFEGVMRMTRWARQGPAGGSVHRLVAGRDGSTRNGRAEGYRYLVLLVKP